MVVSTTAMNEARHNTKSAKRLRVFISDPTADGFLLLRHSWC
jgi:hypothetical protein